MELLSIGDIAGRFRTSKGFIKKIVYHGFKTRNDKVRGEVGKGFCYGDIVAVIRAKAKKVKNEPAEK